MDKMKKLVIILAALAFLSSCNNDRAYADELSDIDSMEVKLTEYRELMDSLETIGIRSMATHVDTQYKYLMANYPDMDDRDFWLGEVAQFGTINKGFSRYIEHSEDISGEIDYSEKQLEGLRNSIRDKKLTDEEIAKYLTTEKEAMYTLDFRYNKYIASSRFAIKMWDAYAAPYDSIVNNLRNAQ